MLLFQPKKQISLQRRSYRNFFNRAIGGNGIAWRAPICGGQIRIGLKRKAGRERPGDDGVSTGVNNGQFGPGRAELQ